MASGSAGGERVAVLRKARGLTQTALARRAGISTSLLSKIEVGDRTLSPEVAAAIAQALRMTLGALYGEAELSEDQSVRLEHLRTAVRRFDIPDQTAVPEEAGLRGELDRAVSLREHAALDELLRMLPGLLTRATTYAHAVVSSTGWAMLADVYSVVYALAARHRWMDLVEIAPARQAWAAAQQPNPLVAVCAGRDRAGTFLNCGDFDGGLTVVDRAIMAAESTLSGPDKAFAAGTLHLRGMTLAGRLNDRHLAQRHIRAAWAAATEFPNDVRLHNQIFGPANTATHVLATEGDLGRPREVVRLADELASGEIRLLPPTRLGPVHINTARARLDLGDRDGAEDSLLDAWAVAPQMARIHPMSLEVLRVLISLHRRSSPRLVKLARQAGINL
ncbi:helix-turn-helix domain-containing protein [Pseudonocardia acaciae]|uniref:helix-turn-helix domain-containing protein n=1 Tax=Pseudonocardia acaciae TaxID=551276 RepID=UPI00048F0A89|nr:helix-turn-helix transcriptional regulator [Pseudonocardia acaciae]